MRRADSAAAGRATARGGKAAGRPRQARRAAEGRAAGKIRREAPEGPLAPGSPSDRQVEGRHPVFEALRSGRATRVYLASSAHGGLVREIERQAETLGVPVHRLERETLQVMSRTRNPQGVIARVRNLPEVPPDDLLHLAQQRGELPLIVAAAGIQDPQNLGALIRSAEAAGAHGLLLPRHRSAALTAAVAKAAAGALEFLPIVVVTNLRRALQRMKEAGLWVYGADPRGAEPYCRADWNRPLVLVIGSEGPGLPRLIRESCDVLVALPMRGRVASLNAAAASAVLLFEAVRQRGQA